MSILQTVNINNTTIAAFATAAALDNSKKLIGDKAVAISTVGQETGSFELFGITAVLPHDIVTTRGLHAEPNSLSVGSSLVDFTLVEESIKIARERTREIIKATKGGNINPLLGDSQKAIQTIQHRKEADIIGLWTDSSVTNNTTISEAADKWDNLLSADSDPEADVATVAVQILADSNAESEDLTGTCTPACFRALQRHPKLQRYFQGAITSQRLTAEQVASALKIKEVIVSAGGVLSSANVRGNIHPNAFNLSYKNDAVIGNGLTAVPTFARYIQMKAITVTSRPHDPITDLDERKIMLFGGAVIQNAGMAGRVITPLA